METMSGCSEVLKMDCLKQFALADLRTVTQEGCCEVRNLRRML